MTISKIFGVGTALTVAGLKAQTANAALLRSAAGTGVEASPAVTAISATIFFGGILLVILGPLTAGPIFRRFGYRVFLNWNVAVWLLGHVIMLGALLAWGSGAITPNVAIGVGLVGLLTWLVAIIRNVRHTNLFVGVWISLIQMPWSLIAIFGALLLNGMLHAGEREQAGQERMRRKGIID